MLLLLPPFKVWLFNLEEDPRETRDLSPLMPDKVGSALVAMVISTYAVAGCGRSIGRLVNKYPYVYAFTSMYVPVLRWCSITKHSHPNSWYLLLPTNPNTHTIRLKS